MAEFPFTDKVVCIGLSALIINLAVSALLTVVFRAVKAPAGLDHTHPDDYYSDAPGAALLKAGEYLGEEAAPGPRPS